MFDWIKNNAKDYPEFWKKYLEKYEKKSNRYVLLNIETSGLNPKSDVILSVGAIAIENELIKVSDSIEFVILQYKYLHDNGISNEFIVESKLPKFAEPNAMETLVDYIGNSIIVGHRILFDIEMINEVLAKMECGKLKNEALDMEIMHQKLYDEINKPVAIEDLLMMYRIPVNEQKSTLEEAYSYALLFLKLKSKLGF